MSTFAGQSYIGNTLVYGDLPQAEMVADGSTTRYGLDWKPGTVRGIYVWVGGVLQTPHRAYHLDDQTVVFHKPPQAGLKIVIRGISHEVTIAKAAEGSIRIDQVASDTQNGDDFLDYILQHLQRSNKHAIALQRIMTPIGSLRWCVSATPPPGWICLDDPEQEYDRTFYADLYQIADAHHFTLPGSDPDHFKLIDLRERFLATVGETLDCGDLGGQTMRQLNLANLPDHSHALSGQISGGSNAQSWILRTMEYGKPYSGYYIPAGTIDKDDLAVGSGAQLGNGSSDLSLSLSCATTGDSQAFDQRPPYVGAYLHLFAGV